MDDRMPILSAKAVLLETRKRDGGWVGTPVSLVTDRGRAYFRTYDASGKAKRLANFEQVKVTSSSLRGKPHGPTRSGRARILTGQDAAQARELLERRFRLLHRYLVPWMHRHKGWTTQHYELVLDD